MLKNFFGFIFELIKVVVISLAIIIPVRYFLIQPFYVKGASMEPNFHDHEYLIIDEISYRFSEPERGDIVVFRYPKNPQEYFIKRVIGLPGETIEIKDGDVIIYNKQYREGAVLEESYLEQGTKTYSGFIKDTVVLEDDEYFVMGDNRNSSKDSRSFGPVNRSFVIGRVILRGWPFDKFGVFKAPEYQF
ncbi:signal peptidase I [Candidatus Falkowbacteria bacterium]|nr:signal peptidase I [Candidatus Falkowbacteria bacterium]